MRTALICKTAPDAFVDIADVQKQLGLEDSDTAAIALAQLYLDSVCAFLDGADGSLKRAVGEQTWTLVLPYFNSQRCFPQRIELPLPPCRQVNSVKYYDQDGTLQTLGADKYRLVNRGSEPSRIVPVPNASWPSTQYREDAVQIEFEAGYGASDGQTPLPLQIRQAVLLMVKGLYDLGQRNVFVSGETVFGVGAKQFAVSDAAAAVMQRAVDSLLFNIRLTRGG